jgi:hypothetical protein
MIPLIVAVVLILLFVLNVYVIYRVCFGEYRERYPEDDIARQMPKGPAYEVFEETIKRGILNVIEAKEYEPVEIVSVDVRLFQRLHSRKDQISRR